MDPSVVARVVHRTFFVKRYHPVHPPVFWPPPRIQHNSCKFSYWQTQRGSALPEHSERKPVRTGSLVLFELLQYLFCVLCPNNPKVSLRSVCVKGGVAKTVRRSLRQSVLCSESLQKVVCLALWRTYPLFSFFQRRYAAALLTSLSQVANQFPPLL